MEPMDLTLPFGPENERSRTWKLDENKREQARSLASRLGISYGPGGLVSSPARNRPNHTTHPEEYRMAVEALRNAGGRDAVNPDDITARKMACTQGSPESTFLNILAELAGFLIFDLPDGQGGFVIIDPKHERTTAWHPQRSTREAACVCGSLVLRESKRKGLKDVDGLADALNSMAIDQETGLMKNLEAAFGHIDLGVNDKPPQPDEVEVINLTQVDLPSLSSTPQWLSFPHIAGAADSAEPESESWNLHPHHNLRQQQQQQRGRGDMDDDDMDDYEDSL
ncbi:uncharacterized protein EV422DRAFT_507200 [Fimicolochytrium jonesii]|uniref:uncharacterized protein n=1 Tax=Fimicolochytrium jonesii TaxID=1396493 RepID=UPI0022FF26CD|nr:uncharacterized protein EV422DRAFT_507200 [Fimicolochytrium jonesii]KAI8819544.1 hypothetical protein EV422DRAFT_507200 [Fimicolochytrium jonesii]